MAMSQVVRQASRPDTSNMQLPPFSSIYGGPTHQRTEPARSLFELCGSSNMSPVSVTLLSMSYLYCNVQLVAKIDLDNFG